MLHVDKILRKIIPSLPVITHRSIFMRPLDFADRLMSMCFKERQFKSEVQHS